MAFLTISFVILIAFHTADLLDAEVNFVWRRAKKTRPKRESHALPSVCPEAIEELEPPRSEEPATHRKNPAG